MREKILERLFWLGIAAAWTLLGLVGCAVLAIAGAPLLLAVAGCLLVSFAILETRRALMGRATLDTLPSPSASRETSIAVKSLALPEPRERLKP